MTTGISHHRKMAVPAEHLSFLCRRNRPWVAFNYLNRSNLRSLPLNFRKNWEANHPPPHGIMTLPRSTSSAAIAALAMPTWMKPPMILYATCALHSRKRTSTVLNSNSITTMPSIWPTRDGMGDCKPPGSPYLEEQKVPLDPAPNHSRNTTIPNGNHHYQNVWQGFERSCNRPARLCVETCCTYPRSSRVETTRTKSRTNASINNRERSK